MTTRRVHADRLALAALALVVAAAFFDVLFLGRGLVRSDLFFYHYPMKQIVRDLVRAGEFPWWNRYYSGGQPMAANPAYEIFYPGQWPIFAGSYRFGFNIHIILHVWLALAGAYLLCRRIGTTVAAALFGSLSYGLSGFFVSTMSVLPTCFVWAWTPLVLALLLRYDESRRQRDFALAALALGMQFLVGEPVALALSTLLVCSLAVYRHRRVRATAGMIRATLVPLAGAIAFGAMVATVQLLPAADHLRDTARAEGLEFESVMQFSVPAGRVLELVFPFYYGHHRESGAYFWGLAAHRRPPYFLSVYLGLAVIAGVLAAFVVFPRAAAALLLFCLPWYLLALGRNLPLFQILYDAGIARIIRYPEKLLAVTVLPLVLLATLVVDRMIRGDRTAIRSLTGAAGALAVSAFILAALSRTDWFGRWFVSHWNLTNSGQADALARMSAQDFFVTAGLATALTLLYFTARRGITDFWFACAALFLVIDLARVLYEISLRMPSHFFEPPGVVQALDDARRSHALFHLGDWYRETLYRQFAEVGDQQYWVARNALLPPTMAAWGIRTVLERDYDETYLRPTRELQMASILANRMAPSSTTWWQPFATLSNVAAIADFRPFEEVARECRGNFAVSRPVALRRSRVDYPRYYIARRLLHAAGWRDVAREAGRRNIEQGDVFVPDPTLRAGAARVERVSESASAATIEVVAQEPSLLVMTVTPHRYWRATIDGIPARLVPANVGYQAVPVPPGRHTIVMRYRNPLVIAGGAITIIGLLALILIGTEWIWIKTKPAG